MKEIYILGILLIFLAVIMTTISVQVSQVTSQSQGLFWNSEVCVYKNNNLVHCGHNILNTGGKNWTRDCISRFTCGATNFSIIALGNITAGSQQSSDTSLANEWTSCGLGRAPGVVTTLNNADGNWTVSNIWTASIASGTCTVNTTALFNQTTVGGTMFAENNFSTVQLSNGDQINVTWTIWVT